MKVRELFEEGTITRLIKDNCQDYLVNHLKEGANGYFLRRLTNDLPSENFIIKTTRKDRRPRDTDDAIHAYVDEAFNETFGIKFRSSAVFTQRSFTSDHEPYGAYEHIVIPMGEYSFCYSPVVSDLYTDLFERRQQPDHDAKLGIFFKKNRGLLDSKYEQFLEKASDGEIGLVMKRVLSAGTINHASSALELDLMDYFDYRNYIPKNDPFVEFFGSKEAFPAFYKHVKEIAPKIFNELIKFYQYHVSDEHIKNIPETHEVMVSCNKYILFPKNMYKSLINIFKELQNK